MNTPNSGQGNPFESNPEHNSGDSQHSQPSYQHYQDPAAQQYQYQQYPDPNQHYQDAAAPQGYSATMKTGKGFIGALFDVNFNNFISLKFAKFIYILAIALSCLALFFGWVLPVLGMFAEGSPGMAMLWLLFGWIPIGLVALFQLVGIRLFLEFVIATIKTAENTSQLVDGQHR